jgi:hypothetical protein
MLCSKGLNSDVSYRNWNPPFFLQKSFNPKGPFRVAIVEHAWIMRVMVVGSGSIGWSSCIAVEIFQVWLTMLTSIEAATSC